MYLFGSRAEQDTGRGTVGPISDYDFGLLVDHSVDGKTVSTAFAHAMAKRLGTDRIDVMLLNAAAVELAYPVIAQGKLLFQRDTATRVECEATVMSRYGDYLPVLRAQRRQILEGGDYAKRIQRYREALGRTRRTLSQIASAPD
ncbi:MAG: nucleotidyltransferase domain-containing protein [Anaerolineae bacterium]|nr:nucleotidyltransferase domain-containing protein [Anaerolineae bacterium]